MSANTIETVNQHILNLMGKAEDPDALRALAMAYQTLALLRL